MKFSLKLLWSPNFYFFYHEIFYQELVIKDLIEKKTLKELHDVAEQVGITFDDLVSLIELNDD